MAYASLSGSGNRTYTDPKTLLAVRARCTGFFYVLSGTLEAAAIIPLRYVLSGERLYADKPGANTHPLLGAFPEGAYLSTMITATAASAWQACGVEVLGAWSLDTWFLLVPSPKALGQSVCTALLFSSCAALNFETFLCEYALQLSYSH